MEKLLKEHEQLEVKHESLGRSLDSDIAAILKTCHDQGMSWDDAKKKIASPFDLEDDWGEQYMQKHWDQIKKKAPSHIGSVFVSRVLGILAYSDRISFAVF